MGAGGRPVKRRVPLEALLAVAIAALMALAFFAFRSQPVVLTPGPCTMLGLATAEGLEGPHLVVDCDGVQFGVRAVMP